MKYIKKLNIDFDQWSELNNECIYLIFRSSSLLYIGYIIKKNNKYQIVLLNTNEIYDLYVINNINKSIKDNNPIFYKYNILYKELMKTDFYKNNKILIVGADIFRDDILKDPELYINKCKNIYKNKINEIY